MRFFKARTTDVWRIGECAKLCRAEHGKNLVGQLNWEHYRSVWDGLIFAGNGAMFLYEEDESLEIVGGIGVAKYQEMLTGRWRACQVFVYVKPEYRGKLSFSRMIRAVELWAIENGCEEIVQPYLSSMPEKTEAYYIRKGYRPLQTLYVKEL